MFLHSFRHVRPTVGELFSIFGVFSSVTVTEKKNTVTEIKNTPRFGTLLVPDPVLGATGIFYRVWALENGIERLHMYCGSPTVADYVELVPARMLNFQNLKN